MAIYSTCIPDDGWDRHPKHVELLHLVGIIFTTKARCTEPQILSIKFLFTVLKERDGNVLIRLADMRHN